MIAQMNIASAVVLVTPPEAPNDLVITVDALKSNCGFASSETDYDETFRDLILQSTDYVEEAARTFLRPVTVDEEFEVFPYGSIPIRLSRDPVRSLTSLTYVDSDGVEQTMDTSGYRGWLAHNPPLVYVAASQSWPITQYGYFPAVTVRYEAGPVAVSGAKYGLIAAVKLIATATWNNRDGREREGPLVIPPAAHSLILATAKRGL